MSLPLSVRSWVRRMFSRKQRTVRKSPVDNRRRFRPDVESLEDRLAPASLTLNAINQYTAVDVYRDNGGGQSGWLTNTKAGLFNMTYTDDASVANTFNTFCIDLFNTAGVNDTWTVNLRNDLTTAFSNGSQMAYIFQTYAQGTLTNNQVAGLQLALWDLSLSNHTPTSFTYYSGTGKGDSGDPTVFEVDFRGSSEAANIAGLVNTYLASAAGVPAGSWFAGSPADPDKQNFIMPPQSPPSLASTCDCPPEPIGNKAGTSQGLSPAATGAGIGFAGNPVRYADGVVRLAWQDLGSTGFGTPWGQTRNWSNGPGYASAGRNGTGMVNTEQPFLMQVGTSIAVITSGNDAYWFDLSGSVYVSRHYDQNTLTYSSGTGKFTFTDTTGNKIELWDFSTSRPVFQRGSFQSLTDAAGNVTQVTSRASDGKVTELQRSQTVGSDTHTESYLYSYISTGVNAGLLANVALRRKINAGSWTTVRQVDYSYYVNSDSYGSDNELKTAVIKDGSGTTLDTFYYRYYESEANGYTGALKYVFNDASYERLAAAFADPFAATDAQVDDYADIYLEYDAQHRVTKEVVQGEGSSVATGGLGTYTFSYAASSFADGYNSWKTKTIETLPDGNQNIVYTNAYGEVMVLSFKETGTSNEWVTFYKYDSVGRLTLAALPSAVSGYNDTYADLLHSVSSNYEFLRDSAGEIFTSTYYASTTATESTAGGVLGYVQNSFLQKGETGSTVKQSELQYFQRTAGGATVNPIANSKVYRNTDGTGTQTTSFVYTWFSGTTQVQSVTTTLPTVTTAQNGPNSADVYTDFYDTLGRHIWAKDPDGFIDYFEYDPATSAMIKSIIDVDTAQTSNEPSGWTTPSGGGLHLTTTSEVDSLGRQSKLTLPAGNITYSTYNDANHEMRIYAGWNTSTNKPTEPTLVIREDRPGSYVEILTMTATPSLDGSNKPTGTESVSSVQTLSRTYISIGGQAASSRDYFNLTGLTYSTAVNLGTQDTHFYLTEQGYDALGRPNRTVSPTLTIYRTVYDALGRVSSTWVGLDDTPTTGVWSPSNNSGADMVQTASYVYDGGGIGDSNLTQMTAMPGGGAASRVSDFSYDWRNRPVASKLGVEASESTSLNRPIFYTEYDNLSEVIAIEQYDGDTLSITTDATSDGVPDKPSSTYRRARMVNNFDEQGRVYRSEVYSVNQSDGTLSSSTLKTDLWFDHRGNLLKMSEPGGLVTKTTYDGAGRVKKVYFTNGGSDSAWSDADDVTGDNVLEQTEYQYDANSNVTLVVSRQHFHSDTNTGELGNPTTNPKARVYYATAYYDLADRLTDSVNVGTNGGSAYTRPGTVPSRSDTVLVNSFTFNAAGWVEDVTDPRGLITRTSYDNLGRVTKTIEGYTDGTPSTGDDRTTEYTYDGNSNVVTVKAVLPSSAYQETKYIYQARTSTGSVVNSNDLLSAMQYPDPSTGSASSSQQETYKVNALGETIEATDRNGSVHAFSFDVVGRLTTDAVTTLGSGVDGAIRRLETAFDTGGRAYLFTSYDASSGGNIVNQVQRDFNGLSQLTKEYQSHSGAVNTGTTPKVQYAYSEMASGANHSRLTSMTYPNGTTLTYDYGTSGGVNDKISRLENIKTGSTSQEKYFYLGLGTVVLAERSASNMKLTYIDEGSGDGGDQYEGLDRFGRTVGMLWKKLSGSGGASERYLYGYDRNGNVLFRAIETGPGDGTDDYLFGELYHANGASNGYDSLNRLVEWRRGELSDSNSDGILDTVTTAQRSQVYTMDAQGNFSSVNTSGTSTSRTHNSQNEISTFGTATLTYDSNGNLTTDETGKTLVWDAWNRLHQVKSSGGSNIITFGIDALGRQVTEDTGTVRDMYYSPSWQLLEERTSGTTRKEYVYGALYIDQVIRRKWDSDNNGSLDETRYVLHDANFNTTAIVKVSGTSPEVEEHYVTDPYGGNIVVTDEGWIVESGTAYDWKNFHQGLRYESLIGLYLNRNNVLSPTLMTWLGHDAMPQFTNLYVYVGNGPVSRVDPWGLQVKGEIEKRFPHHYRAVSTGRQLYSFPQRGANREKTVTVRFYHNTQAPLSSNVMAEVARIFHECIERKCEAGFGINVEFLRVSENEYQTLKTSFGWEGDRFFTVGFDDKLNFAAAGQAGTKEFGINIPFILGEAGALRIDHEMAIAATIAHESGLHVIGGKTTHFDTTGQYIDSTKGKSGGGGVFSPQACALIIKKLGLYKSWWQKIWESEPSQVEPGDTVIPWGPGGVHFGKGV